MRKKNKKIFNGVNYKLFFKKIILGVFIILISGVIIPLSRMAYVKGAEPSVGSLLEEAGGAAKYKVADVESGTISPATVVGDIIQIFLSLLGAIFIILMLYGGYTWMMARGNAEEVTKAIDLIKNAIIGLVIVMAAYAISYFVLFMLAKDYFESSGF